MKNLAYSFFLDVLTFSLLGLSFTDSINILNVSLIILNIILVIIKIFIQFKDNKNVNIDELKDVVDDSIEKLESIKGDKDEKN